MLIVALTLECDRAILNILILWWKHEVSQANPEDTRSFEARNFLLDWLPLGIISHDVVAFIIIDCLEDGGAMLCKLKQARRCYLPKLKLMLLIVLNPLL